MRFSNALFSFVLLSGAFSSAFASSDACGTHANREDLLAGGIQLQSRHVFPRAVSSSDGQESAAASFTVPVIWNVFYDEKNQTDGNIPDAQITQQMDVLNAAFSFVGLRWQATNVRRIPAPYSTIHGALPGNEAERMIKAYRQGDVQTLNIYTVSPGSWWFPWDYQSTPQNDGVVLVYDTLPGGRSVAYNQGKTLIHEVGHWVGLLHTYEGGCSSPGDQVDDTPAQASPTSGCPVGRDSCVAPGIDPINNYMDSSDDVCRNQFTNGQFNRLTQALHQYRGINLH